MQFEHSYRGGSSVGDNGQSTEMRFVPDTLREPTFFSGELAQAVGLREA